MVHAQGEMGSAVRVCVGVEASRDGDFIEEVELTDDVRVELQLEYSGTTTHVGLVDEVSCVVSLPSLSIRVERLVGEELLDFGIQSGGSLFSVAIPNPTSSLFSRVGLLPRCRGVV